MSMTLREWKRLPATAEQVYRYTEGRGLPKIGKIRLQRRDLLHRRGRPVLGTEPKIFTDMKEVANFLHHPDAHQYIGMVWFRGTSRAYLAGVERVFEKTILTVADMGILCSVSARIEA